MTEDKRQIVIPSQFLGEISKLKAGRGTFIENGKIYSGKFRNALLPRILSGLL